MRLRPFYVALLALGLSGSSCQSRHDTDEHELEVHRKVQPKQAPVEAPPSLRDTLQVLVQQLDTVQRIGCGDEAFARLMEVHHAGAQRLAGVEAYYGKDSTLKVLAQHVLQGHERDTC